MINYSLSPSHKYSYSGTESNSLSKSISPSPTCSASISPSPTCSYSLSYSPSPSSANGEEYLFENNTRERKVNADNLNKVETNGWSTKREII